MTTDPSAAPAAPTSEPQQAGSPTFAAPVPQTGYQPATPPAQPAVDPAAQPAAAATDPNAAPAAPVEPAQAAVDPAAPEFKLPDEYKDKPWASKIKNQDDLYKQIDNLQSLVGKKAVVPNLKEATPEEREAFYAQLRGKDASEYVIPENPDFPASTGMKSFVAKLFMDNGVHPSQAEGVAKGWQEFGAQQIAAQFSPEGMKAAMQESFGDKWESITGNIRNSMKNIASPADNAMLDKIPNAYLGLVYRIVGATAKAYGVKETDSAHFQGPGNTAPVDVNTVRQGLRQQLADLTMRPHTSMEQQAIIDKLNATYTNDPRIQQAG